MSTVAENIKNSKIGQVVGSAWEALVNMVNFEGDVDYTVEEAIQATIQENNTLEREVIEAFSEINKLSEEIQEKEAEEQLTATFDPKAPKKKNNEPKYQELEDKLKEFEVKESELNSLSEKTNEERQRGGEERQRIR